jgi:hypothetical protein
MSGAIPLQDSMIADLAEIFCWGTPRRVALSNALPDSEVAGFPNWLDMKGWKKKKKKKKTLRNKSQLPYYAWTISGCPEPTTAN